MKILILTALYPPDIAEPAQYAKEAATRLKKDHEVSILTYGNIPEQIDKVTIFTVNKNKALPFRLIQYFFTLLRLAKKYDVLYLQNGSSVELPTLLVKLFIKTPLVTNISDARAYEFVQNHTVLKYIAQINQKQSKTILGDIPLTKPEILPLSPRPVIELKEYEKSWDTHINTLNSLFTKLTHGE